MKLCHPTHFDSRWYFAEYLSISPSSPALIWDWGFSGNCQPPVVLLRVGVNQVQVGFLHVGACDTLTF